MEHWQTLLRSGAVPRVEDAPNPEVPQEIRKVSGKEVEVPGIGSEDRIEVQVWKNPDLSRTVTVRPDGNISFPSAVTRQQLGRWRHN